MGNLYNVDAITGNIATAGSITAAGGIISTSTTTGFLPPRLTTVQRNLIVAPATGLQIFNTTTVQDEFYDGTAWVAVGAGLGTPGGSNGQVQYNNSGTFGGLTIGTSTTPIFNNAGVLDVSIATPLQIVSGTLSIIIDNSTLDGFGAGNALEVAAGGITNTQISALAAISSSKLLPAGSTTQIQYNNGGVISASSDFTWNDSTATLTVFKSGMNTVLTVGDLSTGGLINLIGDGAVRFGDTFAGNYIQLQAPIHVTGGNYTLKLPPVQGGASTFLQNDGSGNTSWASGGSGAVTVGTAGNMTLYPSTGTSVSDTYVQNTHNITLGIATQSSRSTNLVLTIPNPGNAVSTANVVLDQGSYTIGGTWSFSNGFGVFGTVDLNSRCSLVFLDSGNINSVTIQAPASVTTSYVLNLPLVQGAASTVLQNDGSGNLSWATAGAVTSVHADSNTNITGAVQFVSGTNVTLTQVGQAITVNASSSTLSLTDNHIFVGNISNVATDVAMSGDATIVASGALTLATVNTNVGSFTVGSFTVNAKGLITAASSGSTGNLTDTGTDGIIVTNGTGVVLGTGTSIAQHVADTTHNGYLSSTDWNIFNSKQTAGNYITALTGDITASGPGSVATTLATVNSNVGTFTYPSVTVNGKGLITAISNGSAPTTYSAGTGLTLTGSVFSLTAPVTIALGGTNSITTLVNGFLMSSSSGKIIESSVAISGSTITASLTGHASLDLALTGGTMSGAINMGSHQINSVTDPTSAQDAATKNYVDNLFNGLDYKAPANYATTTTLPTYVYVSGVITMTSTGTVTIDGHTLALNDRILVKNETSTNQPNNGIYNVTTAGAVGVACVLTRSSDYNTSAEIVAGTIVPVQFGTANADTLWLQTVNSVTVGVTNVVFQQFGAGAVTSITGTANQVIASASTGAITLSLPQSINTTATVTFNNVIGNIEVQAPTIGVTASGFVDLNNQARVMFGDSGSTYITMVAPSVVTSPYTIKLPVAQGSASTVLQNDGSGNTSWASVGTTVTTVTTTFTAATASVILANATSAAFIVTLPAAATSTNLEYIIKKIDSSANAITVKGNSSDNIDGTNTKLLNSQYQSLTVVCDGTSWWVI